MRLTREAMLDLMALADGELDGEARDRAERLVAENDEAQRLVETMRAPALAAALGDVLDGQSAAADGIAIERRLPHGVILDRMLELKNGHDRSSRVFHYTINVINRTLR